MTAREALASLPLHERIAAVIDASGLGQDEFADKIGVQRETVNRWANGKSKPNRSARPLLATAASEFYGEAMDAELFRDHTGGTVALEDAVRLLAEATTELIALLAEQRAVVAQLQRIADSLEPPANGGNSE